VSWTKFQETELQQCGKYAADLPSPVLVVDPFHKWQYIGSRYTDLPARLFIRLANDRASVSLPAGAFKEVGREVE